MHDICRKGWTTFEQETGPRGRVSITRAELKGRAHGPFLISYSVLTHAEWAPAPPHSRDHPHRNCLNLWERVWSWASFSVEYHF